LPKTVENRRKFYHNIDPCLLIFSQFVFYDLVAKKFHLQLFFLEQPVADGAEVARLVGLAHEEVGVPLQVVAHCHGSVTASCWNEQKRKRKLFFGGKKMIQELLARGRQPLSGVARRQVE
jgi:hypothetical protein